MMCQFLYFLFAEQHEDTAGNYSDLDLYRETLRLAIDVFQTQKVHIDAIKKRLDWLGRSGIELKKLPQIVFHASKFYDEEVDARREILDNDSGGNEYIAAVTFELGSDTM